MTMDRLRARSKEALFSVVCRPSAVLCAVTLIGTALCAPAFMTAQAQPLALKPDSPQVSAGVPGFWDPRRRPERPADGGCGRHHCGRLRPDHEENDGKQGAESRKERSEDEKQASRPWAHRSGSAWFQASQAGRDSRRNRLEENRAAIIGPQPERSRQQRRAYRACRDHRTRHGPQAQRGCVRHLPTQEACSVLT